MTSAAPTTPASQRGLKGAVVALAVLLLAALVAFGLAFSGLLTIPGITQASGEVVLQGTDDPGLNAFSGTPLAQPAGGTVPEPLAKAATATAGAPISAGATGIYGGTGDNSRCDPAQLITFLGANQGQAAAWVAALNADPNLRWGNNAKLTVADIPAYVAQLTSLVLLTDTLVTNHGYVNGQPTPFQSVLQAGTAVLVDRYGVPRARCFCGNPLLPATTLASTPTVTGTPWPGFNLTNVIVIVNTAAPINSFQVIPYPGGGTPITINAGLCDPANPATCGAPGPAGSVPTSAPTATASPTASPTPQPTTAPPANWTTVPPASGTASSSTTTAAADITFVNNTTSPIDIFWIDFNGAPVHYMTLDPGQSFVQATTEAHVWSITSGSATPIREYSAPAGSSTVTVP